MPLQDSVSRNHQEESLHMAEQRAQRRLAAILAADVVG